MIIIIACPACMRHPEVEAPQMFKSGVTVICPHCGATIRFDLVRCKLEPRPATKPGLVLQMAS
jgi:hypothetical protein